MTSTKTRGVHRHAYLRPMFEARSVAVVGPNTNPLALGTRTLDNIIAGGFRGGIFPVNSKYRELAGRPCFGSIDELPEVPDCVVVATPRESVESIVETCARRGVGGVIVYASGYVETGKPGRGEQQERLAAIAREARMPLLGPNTIGTLNYVTSFHPSFLPAPKAAPLHAGSIGLISQSGALAFSLAQATERGLALSHVLTSGNACDIDVADQIAYLADDPACAAIACVFEGMSNPGRLLEAADIAHRAGKPVVVYKMASGAEGAAAAMSHTGSLAGADAMWRAAMTRAGIVVVDDFEVLIETAAFFAKAPARPLATGVGVIAASGGSCIICADKAEKHGVPLPQPSSATAEVLAAVMPEFGTVRNPVDVTAQGFAGDGQAQSVNAMLADPAYGALVLPRIQASALGAAAAEMHSELAARHGKIACAIWLSEWREGPSAQETTLQPKVATFLSTDRCFATLAAWHARARWLDAPRGTATRLSPKDAPSRAATLIAQTVPMVLTEREAKQVLAAYGVPVVEETLAHSAEEAAEAATRADGPVAMKIESPDIPHKTEAGVIRLNVKGPEAVKQAYCDLVRISDAIEPKPLVHGVLVQPMVPAGLEVMVGARVDPLFGPVIVVGLGGTMVELLKDTSSALAPVDRHEALGMIDRLKGRALFDGFRGSQPVDKAALADIVVRLSEMVADQRERIVEVDVNPLICSGARIVAVDALIVKA